MAALATFIFPRSRLSLLGYHLCSSLAHLSSSLCSTPLILFVSYFALYSMAGSRKRGPSTPKKTPKRPKTKGKQKELPGGALEMSFQLDGVYYQPEYRLNNLYFY